MQSSWRTERNRVILLLASIFCLGAVTDMWVLSFIIPITLFVAFYAHNLNQVYQWLASGTDNRAAPNVEGVLGAVVKQIYDNNRRAKRVNDYLTDLLMRFDATLEAIPDATLILNKSHLIEWSNQAAGSLLGIDSRQDLGASVLTHIRNAEFAEFLLKPGRNSMDLPSPIDGNVTLSLSAVEYAQDKKLLIASDITRHHAAQKSRKQFVANVSHELRTPLTVISGYIDILQADESLPDYARRPLAESLNQVSYMQVLIDELLKLSLLDSNELELEQLEHILLAPHLSEVLSALEASGRIGNRTIDAHAPDALSVCAVKSELDGVCYNLIGNAAKYSDDNSQIRIRWSEAENGFICFSVEDEGLGIAPEHLTRITERFYRVDKGRSRKIGGTGLGLAIVKHILERHGGYLEVHSTIDVGSTFCAYFPIRGKVASVLTGDVRS